MREAYKIAIVSASGRGKTYSFRNMDPNTTGFINLENKPLPFKNTFKHYCKPNDWRDAKEKLIEYAKNPEIKTIIFESFSEYAQSVLRTAMKTKRNFDIWNMYNEEIGQILFLIKKCPKDILLTAHYEWVESPEGAVEKRILVKGKEWKGVIEKEFTITLYADVKISDNKKDYHFKLNSDGTDSAKCPPMLFENQDTITNDCKLVIDEINNVLN